MASYVKFAPAEPVAGSVPAGNTVVLSRGSGSTLGLITYYPTWRQYVFEAAPETVWSHDCLTDVAAKLRELNAAAKRKPPAPEPPAQAEGATGG